MVSTAYCSSHFLHLKPRSPHLFWSSRSHSVPFAVSPVLLRGYYSILGCVLYFYLHSLPGSAQPVHDLKSIYMLTTLQLTPPFSMPLMDFRLVCTSTCLNSLPGCLQYLKLVTSMTELLTAHCSPQPPKPAPSRTNLQSGYYSLFQPSSSERLCNLIKFRKSMNEK